MTSKSPTVDVVTIKDFYPIISTNIPSRKTQPLVNLLTSGARLAAALRPLEQRPRDFALALLHHGPETGGAEK